MMLRRLIISKLSQIFTTHKPEKCENCKENMVMLQVGRYKCVSCGAKDDNY